MSVEDPFEALAGNDTPAPEKAKKAPVTKTATKEKAEPKDAAPFDGMSYFAAEMTIEEDEYVLPESVFSGPYVKPKEYDFIPVRIVSGKVEERNQKSMIVGYNKDRTERAIDPARIEALLEAGGSQEIEEDVPYFQFVMEAEHVSPLYGHRFSPFRLYVSAFDQMIPLKENKRTKDKMGWTKSTGRKLLIATRAGIGRTLKEDPDALQEIADAMVGKIVMARVKYSEPKKKTEFKPRINDDDGTPVLAKIDKKLGEYIKLTKNDDTYVNASSGEVYEGSVAGLIPFEGGFLIPDNSDDGQPVQDKTERESVYDNLQEEVSPVPHVVATAEQVTEEMEKHFTIIGRNDGKKIVQRLVVVHRNDGSKAAAEVTWETVGKIATQKKDVGAAIQALTTEGETITATWLGTQWQETPQPHRVELSVTGPKGNQIGEVRLVAAAPATSASFDFSGLDEFKGGV